MNTIAKKNEKNLDKNNVFHYEPSSMMIFHDYMEKVRFLEKSSFSPPFTFKNTTFLKRKIYFSILDIFIYLTSDYLFFLL
jgi:hypothetical protein